MIEQVSADFLIAVVIIAMGFVTYITRISGFLLIRYVTLSPLIHKVLETIPGTILIAIIAPAVFSGFAETLTAGLIILLFRFLPMIVTLGIGIATVAGLRLALIQMGIENTW